MAETMSEITEHGIDVWRMSAPGDGRSMWYDRDGIFSPVAAEVEVLPMPYDPQRVHLDESGIWLSSVSNIDFLQVWFPEGLIEKLTALGYTTHRFRARHWVELPNEIVFRLDTATEVDL